MPKPAAATSMSLFAVSCGSSRSCTAVGSYAAKSGTLSLSEAWDGTRWAVQSTPNPAGSQASVLSGVSCPTAGACTAVGSYFQKNAGPLTLAEAWNGTTWSIQATPNPDATGRNGLASVSCTSAKACTAVGSDAASDFSPSAAFAETWNGTAWSIRPTPAPSGTPGTGLSGISCATASSCTAVGFSTGVWGTFLPLAMGN